MSTEAFNEDGGGGGGGGGGETDRQSRREDWLDRIAQPKRHCYRRPRNEPTRFSKRGPMSARDWKKFRKWAKRRAGPKPDFEQAPDWYLNRPKIGKPLLDLLPRLEKLSQPRPWYIAEKYIPPKYVYLYSPMINVAPFQMAVKYDKGRPFPPPMEVPIDFQHWEVELNFWNCMRFPVRKEALKYKPSANVLQLSIPRMRQARPRSPSPPPRQKLRGRRWMEHLRRLEYLATPMCRRYTPKYVPCCEDIDYDWCCCAKDE